jgi:ABC-type nitrate/sulfonate/bicarbonate transport system substrate-binding protein
MTKEGLTRRQTLVATGTGVLAAGFGLRPALAETTVRQGYQTNMWGMPTYYLLRSGHLEKHGIKAEEFAVPSGNLTMQQQVARQVDLGTYAGPSFVIGHEKGGLIAIAKIEYVGKTARVMGRKDPASRRSPTCAAGRSPTRPARRPATSSSTRSPPKPG